MWMYVVVGNHKVFDSELVKLTMFFFLWDATVT